MIVDQDLFIAQIFDLSLNQSIIGISDFFILTLILIHDIEVVILSTHDSY